MIRNRMKDAMNNISLFCREMRPTKRCTRREYHFGCVNSLLFESASCIIQLAAGSNPIRTGSQMGTCREVPGWENENVQVIDDVLSNEVYEVGDCKIAGGRIDGAISTSWKVLSTI